MCSSGLDIKCKSREITYEICCSDYYDENNKCNGRYVGETSRSSGERLGEHLKKYNAQDKESMFHKHMIDAHGGERKELRMKITGRYPGNPTLRQVSEALIIKDGGAALNGKEEWGNMNVSRKQHNKTRKSKKKNNDMSVTSNNTHTT